MIKKIVRNFLSLAAILALCSCAIVDDRFSNPDDAIHPGMQVFLEYQNIVDVLRIFVNILIYIINYWINFYVKFIKKKDLQLN